MKIDPLRTQPKLVARGSINPAELLNVLRECGGNLTATAARMGKNRLEVEDAVKRHGLDRKVEDEFLDELEAKVLRASLGALNDPKFNPVTAISVLAKRRPEKWSGRKATATENKLPPPRQTGVTPNWKKRADALRIKYAAVEPTIREPGEPAGGAASAVLSENLGREIVEPDVKGGIREPD